MWKLFSKKEKNMSPTNESKSTAQLKEMLIKQNDTLTNALQRISQLNDEVSLLKSNLEQFKSAVASDVKYLTNRVGE
jgi:predicted RNase H-like nuclease (RuvC/YqgF family)